MHARPKTRGKKKRKVKNYQDTSPVVDADFCDFSYSQVVHNGKLNFLKRCMGPLLIPRLFGCAHVRIY